MNLLKITAMLAVALTVTACAKAEVVEEEMMVKEEMSSSKL